MKAMYVESLKRGFGVAVRARVRGKSRVSKVFQPPERRPKARLRNTFLNSFLAAGDCLKALFRLCAEHGKSSCFLRCTRMSSANADVSVPSSALVNIQNIMD